MSDPNPFRVAWTADFYQADGAPKFADFGAALFENQTHLEAGRIDLLEPVLSAGQTRGLNGVIVLTPRVTAETLTNSENLLAIGRFGVGYDSVDVAACTENNVLAMITVGAVDRPVAEATVAWMLALTHHVRKKDQLVRTGEWDERTKFMGCELRERTLGIVGLGGIGQALVKLLHGFGMHPPLAYDPFVSNDVCDSLGVRSVELDELLKTADFVSIHCPLNEHTRGLIGARELGLMKADAYLLNTARGGIVDEDALFSVLQERSIAGAALDCFEIEPVTEPHRFGELDNVLLAPHSIAWTAELFRDIGRTACQSMLDLSLGRIPKGVINKDLLEKESFLEKWQRVTGMPVARQ